MSGDPIEVALRARFGGERLPASIRDRLVALPRPRPRRPRRAVLQVAAAALLLAAVGAALWWPSRGASGASPHEIAEMIAAHHLMDQSSTFRSDTVADLARAMPRLDFTPRLPAGHLADKIRIDGARYCSVADRIAMQLALRRDERRCTLYLAGPVDAVPRDGSTYRTRIRDLQISLWHEGDRFYGLAEPFDPRPVDQVGRYGPRQDGLDE